MTILHLALMCAAAVVFGFGLYTYRQTAAASVLCPLVRSRALILLGVALFVLVVFFVLEGRWVTSILSDNMPDGDEVAIGIFRAAILWIFSEMFSFIRHLSSCELTEGGYCPMDRRLRQERRHLPDSALASGCPHMGGAERRGRI